MNIDTIQRSHLSWYFKLLESTICIVGIPHPNIHVPCLHPALSRVLGIAIEASVRARWEEIQRGAVIISQNSYCGLPHHCFCFIQENLNLCINTEYVMNLKSNIPVQYLIAPPEQLSMDKKEPSLLPYKP